MIKNVCKSFFKKRAIGFGVGSALIPIVEKEVVEDNKHKFFLYILK